MDFNAGDELGYTALQRAATNGRVEAVNVLVDAGADVNIETVNRGTPLHVATVYSRVESMLALLKRGANIQGGAASIGAPHCVWSAAFRIREWQLWDLLLRWGASAAVLDEEGNTPADSLDTGAAYRQCTADETERVRVFAGTC